MKKYSTFNSDGTNRSALTVSVDSSRNWLIWIAPVLLIITVIIAGCSQNYGRIKKSDDLTAAFNQGVGLPDYSYYYCGRYNTPWAIVGIKPEYQLKERMWKKINTDQTLQDLSKLVYYQDRFYARGSDMLDPSGSPIGVYYSTFTSTAIKMLSENEVEVVCPYRDQHGPDDRGIKLKG